MLLVSSQILFGCQKLELEPRDTDPSWSPDSNELVFVCYRNEIVKKDSWLDPYHGPRGGIEGYKLWEICTADFKGDNRVQITDNHFLDYDPSWSPDGKRIIFVSTRDPENGANLYSMDHEGGNVRQLTFDDAGCREPSYSPDGNRIAYIQGTVGGNIYVMNVEGSNLEKVTDNIEVSSFNWSPDSNKLIIDAWSVHSLTNNIYIVDLESNKLDLVAKNSTGWDPAWSPDGTQFAYSKEGEEFHEIIIIDLQDLNEITISNPEYDLIKPSWSPDTRFFSYTFRANGDRVIMIVDMVSNEEIKIIDFGAISDYYWSPNSKYLAYHVLEDWNDDGTYESKIKVMNINDTSTWSASSMEK